MYIEGTLMSKSLNIALTMHLKIDVFSKRSFFHNEFHAIDLLCMQFAQNRVFLNTCVSHETLSNLHMYMQFCNQASGQKYCGIIKAKSPNFTIVPKLIFIFQILKVPFDVLGHIYIFKKLKDVCFLSSLVGEDTIFCLDVT